MDRKRTPHERALSKRVAETTVDADKPAAKERVAQGMAFAVGMLTADPTQFTGALINPSFAAIVGRLVTDVSVAATAGVVASLLGGPVGWAIAVALIVEHMVVHAVDARRGTIRLGRRVAKNLMAEISGASDEIRVQIRDRIAGQIEEIANAVREVMRRETETLEEELARVALVRSADRSAVEIPRLETISALVEEEFGEISRLVFGRVLTPEERKELERSVFGVKVGENADENAD